MTKIDRPATTAKLSELVVKRLKSWHMYWSAEVNFDKGTPNNKRIDFVGFKPYTPDYMVEAVSVEMGTFACFEVKSCMADFESGNGLTFYGDENYLVTTQEFAIELRDKLMIPSGIDAVLCPDKNWTKLITKFEAGGFISSRRRRSSSEMLWCIVQAHGSRDGFIGG